MFLEKYDLKFDCHSPNINETPKSNEIAKKFVKEIESKFSIEMKELDYI